LRDLPDIVKTVKMDKHDILFIIGRLRLILFNQEPKNKTIFFHSLKTQEKKQECLGVIERDNLNCLQQTGITDSVLKQDGELREGFLLEDQSATESFDEENLASHESQMIPKTISELEDDTENEGLAENVEEDLLPVDICANLFLTEVFVERLIGVAYCDKVAVEWQQVRVTAVNRWVTKKSSDHGNTHIDQQGEGLSPQHGHSPPEHSHVDQQTPSEDNSCLIGSGRLEDGENETGPDNEKIPEEGRNGQEDENSQPVNNAQLEVSQFSHLKTEPLNDEENNVEPAVSNAATLIDKDLLTALVDGKGKNVTYY